MMKRFLKRMNRGVALGILLAVAFSIYVVADTIGFRNDKPTLKTRAEEIVTAMAQAVITPENERNLEAPTRETADAAIGRIETVLHDHMIFATEADNDYSMFYYGSTRDEILKEIKNTLTDSEYIGSPNHGGYLTDCKMTRSHLEHFSKCGVDMAQVTGNVEVEYSYVGNPYLLLFDNPMLISDIAGVSGASQLEMAKNPNQQKATVDWYFTFTLKKVDGDWKINYIESNGWGTGLGSMSFVEDEGITDQQTIAVTPEQTTAATDTEGGE